MTKSKASALLHLSSGFRHSFVVRHSCSSFSQPLVAAAVGATEELSCINITGQSARWHASQVIAPPCIWTAEDSRSVGMTRKRPSPRWHGPISACPLFLNGVTDQCASCRSCRCTDRSRAHVSGRTAADYGPSGRTVPGACSGGSVTGTENERTQRDTRHNGEKTSFHM